MTTQGQNVCRTLAEQLGLLSASVCLPLTICEYFLIQKLFHFREFIFGSMSLYWDPFPSLHIYGRWKVPKGAETTNRHERKK